MADDGGHILINWPGRGTGGVAETSAGSGILQVLAQTPGTASFAPVGHVRHRSRSLGRLDFYAGFLQEAPVPEPVKETALPNQEKSEGERWNVEWGVHFDVWNAEAPPVDSGL